MKVAHLSSVHPAVDTRITVKECGALAAAGHDVCFVCPHDARGPAMVNGVRIVPVPIRGSRLSRVLRSGWDVLRAALAERAAVYHFHDAELLPVGVALRMTGATVIYDVHEDLPRQILAKAWLPRWVRGGVARVAELLEALLSRLMSGIVAATPQIARRFPGPRTVVVQNFASPDELVVTGGTPYAQRAATFAYVGGIAPIRGIFEMLAAMEQLTARESTLVLAGLLSEPTLLERLAQSPGWAKAEYHGWQSRAQVARHLSGARAGLLLIHPTQNYLESYPGKVFEYMAAGLPLVVSDFPLWREVFGDVGCALFVNPLDPAAIAGAMQWLLDNPAEAERMGERGRRAVSARFNWQAEASRLVRFYETLSRRVALPVAQAETG